MKNEGMSLRGKELTITIKWEISGDDFMEGAQDEYLDYLNEIGCAEIVDITVRERE